MVNVDFEEQEWQPERPDFAKGDSKMMSLIMKTGLVKDSKQANYVLIIIAVLFFIFTIYMISRSFGGGGGESSTQNFEVNNSLQEE